MSRIDEKGVIESFVDELEESLETEDTENAILLFQCKMNEEIIEYSSWDVIPIVSSYLTSANAKDKKKLLKCCEDILCIIAEKFHPSETILQLLEQIESLEDDIKFCSLLKPIGISFNRLTNKFKAIRCCIDTIVSYLQDLPIPESDTSDLNEDKDTDERNINLHRSINVYESIISFVQLAIENLNVTSNTKQDRIIKDCFLSLLIYLLGSPYCYLCEDNLEFETKHLIELLREKTLQCIFHLTTDVLYLLNFVNERLLLENYTSEKGVNIKQSSETILENEKLVPTLAYANLYFYIMTKDYLCVKLPQVYHPHFIFQECIYLVNCLFQKQNNVLITKALLFMEYLVKQVEKLSIGSNNLELTIYTNLLDNIIQIMVYCEIDSKRKKALSIFREYINVFNMEARYFLITYLYDTCFHPGVLSLTTTLLKTFIIESLETTPPCIYFSGNHLEVLLNRACHLWHGSETDVVALSDEIITTLNLLRFLLIRDKSNDTGIWNIINTLEESYLKPLRVGIDLCRSHWKTKIKDLENEKRTNKRMHKYSMTKVDKKVILSVGGKKLPALPITQKINLSYQVLCCLDIMESLIIRVNECVTSSSTTDIL